MAMTKIGALWPGTKSIARGFIDWPKTKIVIMENTQRKNDKSPKWYLMAVTDDEQHGGGNQGGGFGQAPLGGGATQAPAGGGGFGGQPAQGGPGKDYPQGWDTGEGGGGGGWG